MSDEEVVITVQEEPGATEPVVVKTEEKLPIDDLKEQYSELQKKNEESERRRQAAEQRAADAARDAERFKAESANKDKVVASSQLDTIKTAIESTKSAIDVAKSDIKRAIENGDIDAQTDAMDRLSESRALLSRFSEAQEDLEVNAKKVPEQKAPPSDPVEAFVAGRPEKTQTWLRAHSEFITDPKKQAKLTAAHFNAVAEGQAAGTDDYFNHVEKFLGIKADDEEKKPEPIRQRKESPIAAPGDAVSNGRAPAKTVTLTPGEARAATDGTHVWNYDDPSGQKKFRKGDPIGMQEFARRKLAMTGEGRYDRSYTEG